MFQVSAFPQRLRVSAGENYYNDLRNSTVCCWDGEKVVQDYPGGLEPDPSVPDRLLQSVVRPSWKRRYVCEAQNGAVRNSSPRQPCATSSARFVPSCSARSNRFAVLLLSAATRCCRW